MRLSLTQRIEILMMIGYGDRIRTQQEVKYPARPITISTVSKLEKKFRETGSVEDIPRKGRPTIPDDKKLDILLAMEEDPHNSVRQISIDHGAAAMTVHNLLTVEKWHPFKIRLVHELNEDDPDRRMEFCQILI